MGTEGILLCIFVWHVVAVQSVIHEQNALFPRDFLGFFDNVGPFPYDTLFSQWQAPPSELQLLAEFPPIVNLPQVEVFCDESKLTLLVDKRSNGMVLTREEIQLGYDCLSSKELPNKFVFIYSLDECGTTHVVQNGLGMFTNSLHFNLKNPPISWWPTPSTVHISCIPKRSYKNENFISTPPVSGEAITIKAMNPSWTSPAELTEYRRGQVISLQVSAFTRPGQQLFIQSCFLSSSPEPQIKPRHAVIMNKGCTAPLGSTHAPVQFVASSRADVVNFVLNTSYLISELYIHCSVLISDQGVTFTSKSCNYNAIQSRWEDLSGTTEVCECCSSKCKGLSMKHLSDDTKAVVSAGPFVTVEKEVTTSLEPPASNPQETSVADSMQSDASDGTDPVVSGTSLSRSKLSFPTQGVVVVSEDPVSRLTLWLPGLEQDKEHGKNLGSEPGEKRINDIPELQPPTKEQEFIVSPEGNNIGDQKWNFLTLLEGWVLPPPHLDEKAIEEEGKRKRWFERSGKSCSEASQKVFIPLQMEMTKNVLNREDFTKRRNEVTEMQADEAVVPHEGSHDAQRVIHSKIQFSKSVDGSQMLSYEEEVVKQQQEDGNEGKQGHKQSGR
ncbi:zona pellucida protein C isoform X2 [Cheilinus undulatus]|uniref:zona pellucida protein C isoform X2 n=1 Tax=Cheilinus undulatus TaxID=241271 RepID=UPI001BD4F06E|nr:zona pellucida protein C isoform X2 [Cheilinus undulatus]